MSILVSQHSNRSRRLESKGRFGLTPIALGLVASTTIALSTAAVATTAGAAPHRCSTGGAPINPYPTMRATGACKAGDGYEQAGGWIPDL